MTIINKMPPEIKRIGTGTARQTTLSAKDTTGMAATPTALKIADTRDR